MKQANNRIPFTKTTIDALPFESKGVQKSYYDSNPTDLMLRVGEFSKTFYLLARIKGSKLVKVSLGKYGVITLTQAKDKVIEVRAKLNAGVNPNLEKKHALKNAEIESEKLQDEIDFANKLEEHNKNKNIQTIDWLLNRYRDEHINKGNKGSQNSMNDIEYSKYYFKANTFTLLKSKEKIKGKEKIVTWSFDREVDLPDLLDRPYRELTQREVLERFKLLSVALPKNNAGVMKPMTRSYQKAFKNLSAAYSFVLNESHAFTDEKKDSIQVDDFIDNPIEVITRLKLWTQSKPRETYIDFFTYDSYLWWKATDEYRFEGMLARDYIFVSLLQGGRSIEIAPLKWTSINLKTRIISYPDTKNKQDYDVPMTNFVYEILARRFKERNPENEYVFAYEKRKEDSPKYIVQSARWYLEEIAKVSGVKVSHHDFRRTITNIALQEGMGIEKITLDHILKHKLQGTDINYFVKNKRIILNALQKIEDKILSQVEYYRLNGNT